METKISSATKEVVISDKGPTILIGERLNPSGRKKLQAALQERNYEMIRQEAIAQVEAGADILDVNVAASGIDEVVVLPEVLEIVMSTVDVPICIDINNPAALKGAVKAYKGKPIINSVTGEEKSLNDVLPVVKEFGTAVIGVTVDDEGIPAKDAKKRLQIAKKIVERAESMGIPREDIIIDSLALSLGAYDTGGAISLEAIRMIKTELGVNQTLAGSNISFGLPERPVLNKAYLALVIEAGVNVPIVNAADVRSTIYGIDLVCGKDRFGRRYLTDYRKRNKK